MGLLAQKQHNFNQSILQALLFSTRFGLRTLFSFLLPLSSPPKCRFFDVIRLCVVAFSTSTGFYGTFDV